MILASLFQKHVIAELMYDHLTSSDIRGGN
jgi:hypothetical protein